MDGLQLLHEILENGLGGRRRLIEDAKRYLGDGPATILANILLTFSLIGKGFLTLFSIMLMVVALQQFIDAPLYIERVFFWGAISLLVIISLGSVTMIIASHFGRQYLQEKGAYRKAWETLQTRTEPADFTEFETFLENIDDE